MQFSIFESEPQGKGCRGASRRAILSGSLMLIAVVDLGAPSRAAEWDFTPRLSVTGGSESDLILDPKIDGAVVDAGGFVDLRPELEMSRRLGRSARLRFSTQGVFERYLNDDARLIYAQSAGGELVHYRRNGLRTRAFFSGSYFDDSRRSTVRRLGGNLGGAVGMVRGRWVFEATGAVQAKRYPHLSTEDRNGVLGTYSESSWSVGANATLRLGRLYLRPEVGYQSTDARDPLFESTSTVLGLRANLGLGRSLTLVASATSEQRDFAQRLAGEDQDEYVQGGVGMDYTMGADTGILARWSFVRYTRTTGEELDTQRVEFGMRRRFGGPRRPRSRSTEPAIQSVAAASTGLVDGAVVRIYAPDATSIHLVGDFNGWNISRDPLVQVGKGWWEIRLDLEPGVYQYKLVVDGAWVLPAEAERTVSDGFGGENAVLQII